MGFLDKLKDATSVVANKTKEAGSSISTASKNAIEKQKIKSAINKENLNIEKQYAEIGKKYVELFGEQSSPEFVEFLEAINKSKEEIVKLNIQLDALEDYITCSCGQKVSKGASFCPNCGSAIVIPTVSDEETSENAETTIVEEVSPEIVEEVPSDDTTEL